MSELTPENINVSTWKIPSPLGIIGSHANGEFNGMTASWITQVSMEPALIGVGIDNKSVTFKDTDLTEADPQVKAVANLQWTEANVKTWKDIITKAV